MRLNIIEIGNSYGIRIPKSLLKQCGLKGTVIVTVRDGNIILSPDDNPRAGWEESFKSMAQAGDDQLLDADIIEHTFDKDEWEW
jgi:antitoxin MazE